MKNLSRRNFLQGLGLGALGLAIAPVVVNAADAAQASRDGADAGGKKPKILVAYFSHTGHTKKIAEDIHKAVGGDLIRIEEANPYPAKYNDLTEFAKKELEANARPKIKTRLANPGEYDLVFLGYPNWWSSMPMPVYTFVEENGLDGKTIAPFSTHGGGGLGHSVEDLRKIAPHAKVLKALAVNGNRVDKAEEDVLAWLKGLGPALIMTTTGNPAIYPDGGY